jgi:hypothetical protein
MIWDDIGFDDWLAVGGLLFFAAALATGVAWMVWIACALTLAGMFVSITTDRTQG